MERSQLILLSLVYYSKHFKKMEDSMSASDVAAEYFRSILHKKSPKVPFPIVRLIGHRNCAPPNVCIVVKNVNDLEGLLLNYPEVFHVENGNVGLLETLKSKNGSGPAGSKQVAQYFASVLRNGYKYCPYLISQLFCFRSSAIPSIQSAVESTEHLKKFIKQNPDIITIFKKYAVLTESIDTINRIITFYVTLINSTPNKNCSFKDLSRIIENAPSYVQLAVKSESELKELLSCFSKTFKIDGDDVTVVGNQSFITKNEVQKKNKKCKSAAPTMSVSHGVTPACSQARKEVNNNKGKKVNSSSESDSSEDDSIKSEFRSTIDELKKVVLDGKHLSTITHDNLKNRAATYFSQVLWESKPFNVVPIVELFGNRFFAPLDIQSVCGKTLQEFKEFLSRCNESFIVTGEYVLPRKNIPKEDWSPPYRRVEEPLSSVLINFFKTYICHGKPIHISKLYSETGKCFVNNSGIQFFESPSDLGKFLEMFPDSFYISNDHVVNILNFDKECVKEVSRKKSKRKKGSETGEPMPDALSNKELSDWKEEVLKRTIFIEDLTTSEVCVQEILDEEKVIALDCEGANLGENGILSLVQIATEGGKVYIFDVLSVPEILSGGKLKQVLESPNILKVIHDCHNDSANLYHEFEVTLKNIFDTRIAHGLLTHYRTKTIGFNNLCKTYGAPINIEKDELKDVYKTTPAFWLTRPVTSIMQAYAALDVACLVPHVYDNMREKLKGEESRVIKMSEKYSRSNL